MQEKEAKKQFENTLEKKQAEIWKKDTAEFIENEASKKKNLYAANKQHEGYLMQQMELERKRRYKKMTPQELLFNKDRLKGIAEDGSNVDAEKFRKTQVSLGKTQWDSKWSFMLARIEIENFLIFCIMKSWEYIYIYTLNSLCRRLCIQRKIFTNLRNSNSLYQLGH